MRILFILSLFLLSFFYSGADASRIEKPFIAVFANPGSHIWWEKYKPNLYYTAKDWDDLPLFLSIVKKKLHPGQELYLDIDCHGSDDTGLLVIQYEAYRRDYSYEASVGGLLNKVKEAKLKPAKLFLEACYSQICIEKSFKDTAKYCTYESGNVIEDYRYKDIKYPIYGAGTCPSVSNLIFLEDKYQIFPFFKDLRQYIGKPVDAADHTYTTMLLLAEAFSNLYAYGND